MKRNLFTLIILCLYFIPANSQWQKQLSSGEIYEELEKFNFLGSVLYIAAHPDDENTRLISYLSNGLHARTAYLSLTRGDGGQNLIGTEIRELLGVLRSQELQMARATDGGQQFFTRANDFGYSKHPDETLEIWNKEQVFDDIIRAIRTFRPDIIINRFDHRTPGRSHGHHTSSAMLSVEAFDKSNNISFYPYQLKDLEPWQVRRQFFNTSWWFYGSREKFAQADKSRLVSVEVGGYYPTLGISNNEISGLARSKHRSQGFGSSGSRSSMQEYLELINGDMPKDRENIFDGINTSWTRVKNGDAIDKKMKLIFAEFDFRDPSSIVSDLIGIYPLLDDIEDNHWKKIKKTHLDKIVQACMGLFIEVSTIEQQTTPGDSVEIEIEITSRSNENLILQSFEFNDSIYKIDKAIGAYVENLWYEPLYISENTSFTNPYWLNKQGTLGTYKVDNPLIRNLPESPAAYTIQFNFTINGQDVEFARDVIYLKVDPSIGEIREPIVVIPPATMSFDKDMYLFSELNTQEIEVKVRSTKDELTGTLKLDVPDTWSVEPKSTELSISNKGMEKSFRFILTAPENISEGHIDASFETNGKTYTKSMTNIVYDHIPLQTILKHASSKIVKVPMKKGGTRIAYIMGAGDKMPESLEAVGYNITLLEPAQLNNTALDNFNAIVIGIRAYNTLDNLWLYNELLFDYVKGGGTLITQYNTSRRLNFDHLAPYPIKLSRKRVTDEYAEMRIINPDHKVLHYPNVINDLDFKGWVQERGLYFAEEWDDSYETIWSCNDKNEDALDGSLLIASHGEGHFVYTSISWFRQLPAGVPGAYRIFANLLALSSPKERP